MSLTLDHSLTLRRVVGPRGLPPGALRAGLPRLSAARQELESASSAGLLPHHLQLAADPVQAAQIAAGWTSARRVVLGEPGAVGAATLFAGPAARAITAPPEPSVIDLSVIDGADLIVLQGPSWVRHLSDALAERAASRTLFSGDGTDTPPWELDGACWTAPGTADARFGVCGLAALSLAAAAGHEPADVITTARRALEATANPGLSTNPALRWAAAALALQQRSPEATPWFLPAARSIEPVTRQICRAWGAITSGRTRAGTFSAPKGIAPRMLPLGDEARAAMLLGSPAPWVCALSADGPDTLLGPGLSTGALSQGLLGAQIQHLVTAGVPVLQIRMPSASPGALAALSVTAVQAALLLSIVHDLDPLAVPGADRLRALQDALWMGGEG